MILEWVAVASSRGSSRPQVEPVPLMFPALAGGFFTTSATWEACITCVCVCVDIDLISETTYMVKEK